MLESGDPNESQTKKGIRCCAYKDCSIQIAFPMWGKYCKLHRQKVYKKNYQKKSYKLKAKYKESKECFSGSPDFFDGQDINEMLQQVLFKKRMELMCCPSVVCFLKKHQELVKAKSRENVKEPEINPTENIPSIHKDGNQLHGICADASFQSKKFWLHQTIIPERLDRGLVQNPHSIKTKGCYIPKSELETSGLIFVKPGDQLGAKLDIPPRSLGQGLDAPFLKKCQYFRARPNQRQK